ncbi:MAG: ribosome silencing factor [Eubacterium sp.]|nr:ribosome silencing factor [Eubacterium sp.]MCR5292134.1 ribosome silencing factor [Eubacterium sp.]
MDIKERIEIIKAALSDKKATDINVLDISEKSVISDYFIIASGSNRNQIEAICDNVEEELYKVGVELRNREGRADGGWILLDYDDIIVHIFTDEMREFYDLDHTWRDAKIFK